MNRRSFLIIQTAFIGDVVLATSLIEKLHQYYPDATIDFLLRKGNEGLLIAHPYLRNVLIWDKKKDKQKNLFELLRKIRGNKYDVVINVQRFAATGMLTAFSGAGETIGFNKNPLSFLFTRRVRHIVSTPERPLHEIQRNQKLIEKLTDALPEKPRLYPSAADRQKVAQYKQVKYICVAPASVWYTKQFPAEKWISFIRKVPVGIRIYLLGAPGDAERCEQIKLRSEAGERVVNLAGKLGFLESAALQEGAVMSYVNDSAPMHFASAMNAPVTAVYCSTLPSFGFGPLSDKSNIVEVKEKLPCRPCGLHGRKACPLKHFDCAMKIADQQLLDVI
jgi:ADP-heptose:LPS heptosyltransferase